MTYSTTLQFYMALNERWQRLFDPVQKPETERIPRLTTLAKKVLLNHLSIQSLPAVPHSLIKKVLPNGFTIFIQERQNPKQDQRIRCEDCGTNFDNPAELRRHRESNHTQVDIEQNRNRENVPVE